MITTETTPRSTLPADFTADQARALLDQIARIFPTVGPLTSGQLAGALTLAWHAGYAAASAHPVCDWCGEAVVPKADPAVGLTRPMWAHQATGLYGCEHPVGQYAQVNGGGTPAQIAAVTVEPEPLPKPKRHEERECPRCGTRIVWTGYYAWDGHWEHCDEGTSGTLSCNS